MLTPGLPVQSANAAPENKANAARTATASGPRALARLRGPSVRIGPPTGNRPRLHLRDRRTHMPRSSRASRRPSRAKRN